MIGDDMFKSKEKNCVVSVVTFCITSRYGKKIWLTEFAKCCTHDENEIMEYARVSLCVV